MSDIQGAMRLRNFKVIDAIVERLRGTIKSKDKITICNYPKPLDITADETILICIFVDTMRMEVMSRTSVKITTAANCDVQVAAGHDNKVNTPSASVAQSRAQQIISHCYRVVCAANNLDEDIESELQADFHPQSLEYFTPNNVNETTANLIAYRFSFEYSIEDDINVVSSNIKNKNLSTLELT